MIILFGIMIVFVLVMIIPQKRKEKKQKAMLDAIKPGDEIRTIGGIYGKVKRVKSDLVTITTGPKDDTLVFTKSAIEFVTDPEAEKKAAEEAKAAEEEEKRLEEEKQAKKAAKKAAKKNK